MALMLGAISPGPSFIYVAQNSISKSRKHGLFTALGTGTGAALLAFSGYGVTGSFIGSAFSLSNFKNWWWAVFALACFKIIKHAKEPIAMENDAKSKMTYKQAYRYGLITQLSNPKIAVVLASVLLLYCQKKFQIITTSHYRSFVL